MEFGKRLEKARIKAGFKSKSAFAKKLGVKIERYLKWEQGNSFPSVPMLATICSELNVSCDYLIGIDDNTDMYKKDKPAELADLDVVSVTKRSDTPLTQDEIQAIRALLESRNGSQE